MFRNEKDTEDEADTVGCCSLRVEHITFTGENIVNFDFLGKDSMRYQNSVQVLNKVFRNLKEFAKNKPKDEKIFDQLTVISELII
jgi:DNA topoisomerase-1